MRQFKVITDPGAMELLGDETRRRMIYLLRARESTISQVAEELEMTPQAIYHHVKKLLKAGMVEVAREERVENFIEKYYRATAEIFQFSWGADREPAKAVEEHLRDTISSLPKIGIKIQTDDDKPINSLVNVQQKLNNLTTTKSLEDKISKLDDVDFVGKAELRNTAAMITMTDKEFQEWLRLQTTYREQLRNLLSDQPKKSART